MAEKLLLIKSLGYLPNDIRWSGFRICEQRAIIITPSGREFSPKELESFVFWRDEHRQLVEKFGHIDQPKVYPAKENVLPFKGGRRMKAAEWVRQNYGDYLPLTMLVTVAIISLARRLMNNL